MCVSCESCLIEGNICIFVCLNRYMLDWLVLLFVIIIELLLW